MPDNKKKVLYIITKSDVGGAQKYIADLSENIDKNRFEAKKVFGGVDIKHLSNKTSPFTLFINDWLAIFEMVSFFKKEAPDIVHLNSSKAGVLGSLAGFLYNLVNSKKLKIVFTAHGWIFNPQNKISYLEKIFYASLHKMSSFFQDAIINVSNYDKEIALQYKIARSNKLFTVWNGVDPKISFLSKEDARKEIIARVSNGKIIRSENNIWIGSIGRLVKEKDYQTLIMSAKKVDTANFFIIGDGYEKEKLIKLIASESLQDKFFIITPQGKDSKLLKAFDIFVLSSVKEGLPYTLIEAMASETPIIATKTGGITEILKGEDGKNNGILVPIKSPETISQSIHSLLKDSNLRKSLIKNAKDFMKENLTLEKMVKETESIYQQIS